MPTSMSLDQFIRLVEALAWPVSTLIFFIVLRPWRVVTHLINQGGTLEAAGVKLDLPAKILGAQTATQAAPSAVDAAPVEAGPLAIDGDEGNAASIDPYSLIISSWSDLVRTLDTALKVAREENRDWRGPDRLLEKLRELGALSDGLHRAVRDLLDVRNQVKRNGPENFHRLGIASNDAERFAGSARTIKTAVEIWIDHPRQQ